MAIRVRRGNKADFDPKKFVAGELGLAQDTGELYFCYSPGNVKKLQTAEDLQNLLDASPQAYSALQQLVADLSSNPNQLANILSNISSLQNNKIDKASIIQSDTINDSTKVASAAVTHALGQEIDVLNNKLVKYNMTVNQATNQNELDNILNNASDANNQYYRLLVNVNFQSGTLSGGFYYVEGYRRTIDYEWQRAIIYSATGAIIKFRSKFNGVWNDWVDK